MSVLPQRAAVGVFLAFALTYFLSALVRAVTASLAPLTGFRCWLTTAAQLHANAWMMMTGSLGMVASTLPV